MIHLTRLNHLALVLNADLIESIEVTPDTVISLTTGQKLVVLEPAEEVVRRVVEYRRAIYSGMLLAPAVPDEPGASASGRNRMEHGSQNRTGV
ncbi:MAG TPA: flagellar FlbD family protein [Bryobacteraceae bacterium]|nr:flagellar FlbD family protein [Bryobacteraceae bacterium]